MQKEELVQFAQQGNKEAFVRLIHESETTMYRVAKSILKTDDSAADAIQETILKAFSSIGSLREPKFFKTWLIRILINICKRIIHSNQKVVPIEEWMYPTKTPSYISLEIQNAMDFLEDDHRTIVTLFYYEDLKIKEIAEVLEIREGTVKSRLNRARGRLAKLLGNHKERGTSYEE